jgi:hypothetical protein
MIMRTLLALVMLTSTALADDVKVAEELFARAQERRAAGDEAGACSLFEESRSRNPNAVGTILNVALCDEKAGKLASAVRRFRDARDRAREQQLDEHRVAAEQHLTDLAGRIGYLTLAFVEKPTAATRIELDGQAIENSVGTEILVDAGSHTIHVSAPGRVPFDATVALAAGEHEALAVPVLAAPTRSKFLGKVVTAGGVTLVATASVVALVALRRYNSAFDEGLCMTGAPPRCGPEGYDRTRSAQRLGTTATIVGAVGVTAVVVGMYFWLRPDRQRDRSALVPTVTSDGVGLAGTF